MATAIYAGEHITRHEGQQDNLAMGYLRAFVTLLVLAHHVMLGYHPYAPPPPKSLLTEPRWWQAFPVVDHARSGAFGLLVSFNDVYFMSLMFFLSGLFVWKSYQRKGAAVFLKDRARRLGIPFVFAAALIAPLAYYPTFLQIGGRGLGNFWAQWLALGQWPAGPAWFLWLLLTFDAAAALSFTVAPRWVPGLGGLLARVEPRPVRFFWLLISVSALVYIPLALVFHPISWTTFGPFAFQTSRVLLYGVYFAAGIAVGGLVVDKGLLSPEGKLARRWAVWILRALGAFGLFMVITIVALSGKNLALWNPIGGLAFVISCAASSLALIAVFTRFVHRRRKLLDSLRQNAYGMYAMHYAFVSWLEYLLLPAAWPAAFKALTAFAGTVLLSWIATAALRKLPGVARVL